MREITFEDLKKEMEKFQGKDLYVEVSTLISTFIIIKKCRIVIDNYRIVLSDGEDGDIEIEIEPIIKIELSEEGNSFYLKFSMEEMVILVFDKNS